MLICIYSLGISICADDCLEDSSICNTYFPSTSLHRFLSFSHLFTFFQTSESSELSSLYTEVLLDDGGIDRKVSEYMQSLLRERFTNKMLEIVDELQVAYSHHDLVRGAGSVFPVRAGKCNILWLAFVIFVWLMNITMDDSFAKYALSFIHSVQHFLLCINRLY